MVHDPFQLIIPMTGLGQRFLDAGYLPLKPLIETGFGSMIAGVFRNYPSISSPICIISSDHEQRSDLRREILHLRPKARILEIPRHKLGPSFAVAQIRNELDVDEISIINYCDFSGIWSERDLISKARTHDGLILVYRGFHPHMLRSKNFAFLKIDTRNAVSDIREKRSFTSEPTNEFASSGTYVFRRCAEMLKAIDQQISEQISLNGEFYTSLTFLPMIRNGMKVGVMEIPFFFQWGTPEDLKDFRVWSTASHLGEPEPVFDSNQRTDDSTTIILAAGNGLRLQNRGVASKPLLRIFGKPLWSYSAQVGATSACKIVVALKKDQQSLQENNQFGFEVVAVDKPPANALLTCNYGLTSVTSNEGFIHIMAADNIVPGVKVDEVSSKLASCDLIVWVARDYLGAIDQLDSFSWVSIGSKDKITALHLKKIAPLNSHLIIGNFSFKNKVILGNLIDSLLKKNFNIAELSFDLVIQEGLEQGLAICAFYVELFSAVGTELELNIAQYYEDAFTNMKDLYER